VEDPELRSRYDEIQVEKEKLSEMENQLQFYIDQLEQQKKDLRQYTNYS